MKKYSSTTKANSRQTSRRARISFTAILGIFLLSVLFVVPSVFGSIGSVLFSPIIAFEEWIHSSGGTIPSYFRDRNDLLETIKKLENELVLEDTFETQVGQLRAENGELRSLIGMGTTGLTAARVIGRPTNTPYDVLVLDKGSLDGVEKHAPVYIGDTQIIGIVGEVFPMSSIVVLATTPSIESTVYIFGPNIYTTARGMGGGVLSVSVPQGIPIRVGDVVALPSFGTGIFGRISHIESVITEPEQQGFVTLPIPLQSIRLVGIGAAPVALMSFEEAAEVVGSVRQDLFTVPVPSGVLIETDVGTSTETASSTESATSTETEELPSEDE